MQDAAALPDGYTVPVHRALTEPILIGGAPRTAAILNGTIAATLGLGMHLFLAGIIYWIAAHAICVWAAKRDPDFMDVLVRHVRHKRHLSC